MTTTTATTEYIVCPMCRSDCAEPLIAGGDLLHPGDEQFQLVSCGHCGHIYQNPRPTPDAIGRYYPDDYIPFLRAIADEPRRLKRWERRYGRAMRCGAVHRAAGQTGRLLDVGCATGIFLDGMRRRGWEVQGVEPTASAAEYARTRLGLPVITGRLEETSFPDGHFDAVTLWDVLEHVHEPRETLREIARLLRPGGLLVLSLPNPDSLEARLLGPHWLGWDLPRHLNLFPPLLLREHLRYLGLPVDTIRSFTAGYSVLVMSLENRLRAAGHNTHWVSRVLNAPPLRLLAKPYYAGPANWYNLSSIMVVFARRDDSDIC